MSINLTMKSSTSLFIILFILTSFYCTTSESAKGYGPGEQDWGFIDVREGAHMFYWLYYTNANVSSYTERPLVVWMVGGPGSSSAGYGNFDEVGPMTLDGKDRYFSWDKHTNLLFIDSPVGAGYSYADDDSLLTTNNTEIAWDFVSFMKLFYAKHPEFETVPLHLFGESYGGKMIAEISLELYRAIKRGELLSNFKSVTMMTPRIAMTESTVAGASYLLSVGAIDEDGYEKIMKEANIYVDLMKDKNYVAASMQGYLVSRTAYNASRGVNFFNILRKRPVSNLETEDIMPEFNQESVDILEVLMAGEVAKALSVNASWGHEILVKTHLINDMERPINDIIITLLDTTDLEVGIVTAQLDYIAGPLGFVEFMKNLNWSYKDEYEAAPREGFSVNGALEGYKKSAGKFTFFWVNRAGHMISQDNPDALNYILKYFTNYEDSNYTPKFL